MNPILIGEKGKNSMAESDSVAPNWREYRTWRLNP
jgi:hypothetical protein